MAEVVGLVGCLYGNWADAWRTTIAEWKTKIKKEAFEKKGNANVSID